MKTDIEKQSLGRVYTMTPLSFTVQPKANALDGITLYEPIDRHVLEKLIHSTLLRDTFNNKVAAIYKNEKQQLQKYLAKYDNGRVPITYKRCDNNPYGRSNPAFAVGLYPIRREIRHTLASGRMVDLDVQNCHPVMLSQICEYEKFEHPCLSDYCINRSNYFALIQKHYGCSDEVSKNLFIMLINGGGFKKWLSNNKITHDSIVDRTLVDGTNIIEMNLITKFRNEMATINKHVEASNPHMKDIVIALKLKQGMAIGTYNLGGSMTAFMLQEYEIRVLEAVFIHCSENGLIEKGNCVLCADGLMLESKFYNPTLLSTLSRIIRESIGFELVFTEKAMNKSYLPILDKHLEFDLYSPAYTTGLMSGHFATMFANKFVYHDGSLYTYNGVCWNKNNDKKHSALHNFIDTKFYSYMVGYCTRLLVVESEKLPLADESTKKVIDDTIMKANLLLKNVQLLRKMKQRKELVDDIINKIVDDTIEFDSDPFLFTFSNKIYDLKSNKFVPPLYNQYVRTTCGYEHYDYYSAGRISVMDNLIDTILPDPDVKEYYMMSLATGLYGQQIENIFIANGSGGNGKSLLNAQMIHTVGDYGYKLGANVLLGEIKEGGNPAVALLHKKRFVLIQEPNGKRRMCCATMKEITGDRTINARMNYSNNCTIELCLTLTMECNALPLLDEVGGGVERRIRAIPFTNRFVSNEVYDALHDKAGYGIADPSYKTSEFQSSHRQALFEILLRYWKRFQDNGYVMRPVPEACKKLTVDYMAASDDIYGWFSEKYEKGDPTKDMIYAKDIYRRFTSSDLWDNMSKADRRNNNQAKFYEKIEKNIFLSAYYKPRDAYFGGDKLDMPFIVGFKKISNVVDASDEDTYLTDPIY